MQFLHFIFNLVLIFASCNAGLFRLWVATKILRSRDLNYLQDEVDVLQSRVIMVCLSVIIIHCCFSLLKFHYKLPLSLRHSLKMADIIE